MGQVQQFAKTKKSSKYKQITIKSKNEKDIGEYEHTKETVRSEY